MWLYYGDIHWTVTFTWVYWQMNRLLEMDNAIYEKYYVLQMDLILTNGWTLMEKLTWQWLYYGDGIFGLWIYLFTGPLHGTFRNHGRIFNPNYLEDYLKTTNWLRRRPAMNYKKLWKLNLRLCQKQDYQDSKKIFYNCINYAITLYYYH